MKTEIQKMQEEIDERIKNKPELIEYGFGIQKFDNAADAFEMMEDVYGTDAEFSECQNIVIGNLAFTNHIVDRVVTFFYLVKTGEMPKEQFEAALMMNGTKTDELLSFNFFLYNEKNNCFYASLMEYCEDDAALLSKRQWEIYHEIWEAYCMTTNLMRIVIALNLGFKEDFEDKNKPIDESYFKLVWDWFSKYKPKV